MFARGAAADVDARGRQFLGFTTFSSFKKAEGLRPYEVTLISPIIDSCIRFNEVVPSWNIELPEDCSLTVEAQVLYPERGTKFYNLGKWSNGPAGLRRQSFSGQGDVDGDVSTDTLILRGSANRLQVRLRLAGENCGKGTLKFVGISLTDSAASPEPLPAERKAWGKLIAVPERSQMVYPNGKALCSPTTVSMLMSYWAQTLKRPELEHSVPEIADAIYDSQWQGTGNWSFNMAYAGSFAWMRAYVTRLSDVCELESWIAKGFPVGLSVDYDRLRAKGPGPNGHLVVLVGFTKEGDPIINDPGTTEHVRKTFPRKNLIDAWGCSRNTVYLIYPENVTPPVDRFGHWYSRRQ